VSSQRAVSLPTVVTVLYTLAAYNWFLSILAGLLFVVDGLKTPVWIAMYASAGSLFWVFAGLFSYLDG